MSRLNKIVLTSFTILCLSSILILMGTRTIQSQPDVMPPAISILSPENKTYSVANISLIFMVNETASWIGYSLDGQTNVTIAGNTTLFDLEEGSHSILVYANDTSGNMGMSSKIFFTIAFPPEYTLTLYSLPSEVTFGIDNVSYTTPWSGTYIEGTSLSLEMPGIHTVGDVRYYWNKWSDGNTSRSRTVTMDTNITLTANYSGPYHELTTTSSPVTGITFTIYGTPQTTPYIEWLLEGSYTIEMPETHNGYVWSHWLEDGDTNRTKVVVLHTNVTLTGVFRVVVTPTIDIDPDTLNLKSKGRWITCYIELPEGRNVSDIDRATMMLNGTLPIDPFWVDKSLESVVGDHDDDDVPDLMVKFSRAAAIEYLLGQNITCRNVTLTVTGELYDGTSFEGSDVIRVKMPSDVNSNCDKCASSLNSADECDDNYDLVMPEFQSFLILPLFVIATLLAARIYRGKQP